MRKADAFALGKKHGYDGMRPRPQMPVAYILGYRLGHDKREEERMVEAMGTTKQSTT